ncbi:hypothetical protein [Amycolatopsis rubida]|uniref:hypothetical protein n=1 Tax=Amycolatopsis rubida TaxID=112413 RepID=UPI00082C378B|nr:hypothetical protein [Amycolatopsis rubida]
MLGFVRIAALHAGSREGTAQEQRVSASLFAQDLAEQVGCLGGLPSLQENGRQALPQPWPLLDQLAQRSDRGLRIPGFGLHHQEESANRVSLLAGLAERILV